MMPGLGPGAAFALAVVLFAPVEIPAAYLAARRAVRAWRRWSR